MKLFKINMRSLITLALLLIFSLGVSGSFATSLDTEKDGSFTTVGAPVEFYAVELLSLRVQLTELGSHTLLDSVTTELLTGIKPNSKPGDLPVPWVTLALIYVPITDITGIQGMNRYTHNYKVNRHGGLSTNHYTLTA